MEIYLEPYTENLTNALDNYGNNPIQLYNALKSIHEDAYSHGNRVIYPSGQTFRITITDASETIPLSPNTDFNGCIFEVTNNANIPNNWCFLFKLRPDSSVFLKGTSIDKNKLKKGACFYGTGNHPLNGSPRMLRVVDQSLWTQRTLNMETFNVYREDLLLLNDNVIQNDPIAGYDNCDGSNLATSYVDIDFSQKSVRNVTMVRKAASTAVTNFLLVEDLYNIRIENITVNTEQVGSLSSDYLFYFTRCMKLKVVNVSVNNTYSSISSYGYAFTLDNVVDSYFERINAAHAAKGVFAGNNVNKFTIVESCVNRVDVHCYGRDFTCIDCTFRNTVNQVNVFNRFSSFFGKLKYINCFFDEFLPVRLDSDYNAFTPFDLVMENCVMKVLHVPGTQPYTYNCLVHTLSIPNGTTGGQVDAYLKCLPNIYVSGLKLIFPTAVTNMSIFKIMSKPYSGSFNYMNMLIFEAYASKQVSFSDVAGCTIQLSSPLTRAFLNMPQLSATYNITSDN